MWTQRDLIQAYQFLRRRLVSALASADADHPVSPSGRLLLGTALGPKYPVAGGDVIPSLGYGRVRPYGVPAPVLAMFPTGATLDPAEANRTTPR
ncbi:type VII secretion protein EccB [Plantactinospora sp. S1510]|uniref:Type VII secretion protein EccB n=1 Tax=Plantactinospora alkalitolerans TaxID=2789879 RepID=A0ABS0GX43_9ACTN|nr:type VII secretion protein EccB [Plantactinospora alkalitolerans]MBF9130775.1 type VII secretion protein EccB [Plantactinospora alkalitolerans]